MYAVRITNEGQVWHLGMVAGVMVPMIGTMGAAVFGSREAAREALQGFLYHSYGVLVSCCGNEAVTRVAAL